VTISGIRPLIFRGYGNSVVRRSLLLLCLMGPAFAVNLMLYYVASLSLSAENFGHFYIAVTTVNVLYSASFVLNVFFTRYLVSVIRTMGEPAAYAATSRIQMVVTRCGALGATGCIVVLSGLGKWIGVESWSIVILIVLDAYAGYIVDVHRALLQSLRKTMSLGSLTLCWMILRFLLGSTGMYLFGTAWSGMLGTLLATVLVICVLLFLTCKGNAPPIELFAALPSVGELVPVTLGYVSLIAVSNLDVLLSYLLLKDDWLGAYSASSVFPKGILVFVTPLLQMLYPMMVGHEETLPSGRIILQKSVGMIFLLSSGMALSVFGFSGLLCGAPWGLKSCQPDALHFLLISAVSLSMLRALVFYQSARGHDWMALYMLVPVAAYVWIAVISSRAVETVAIQFTIFSVALLPYYGGLAFLLDRRRHNVGLRSAL